MTSKEILEQLKKYQNKKIETMLQNKLDEEDTIILYHGTSSRFLNDILKNGLQPRLVHGNSMYDDNNPSNEHLVYLTNYLQYKYAFSTTITNMANYENEKGLEYVKGEDTNYEQYYSDTGDAPMILTVEIPKSWLIFDEDIAYFKPFKNLFLNNIIDLDEIDWNYSMKQFTCASIKAIPPKFIKKVEFISYYDLEIICEGMSNYANKLEVWANGFEIKEENIKEATKELVDYMYDMHLGAFEEIFPKENEQYKITYEHSALFARKITN